MKRVALAFACLGIFAIGACGVDNVTACTDAQDAYNAAGGECLGDNWTDIDWSCDSYSETTCDMGDYWTCWEDISCDDSTDPPTIDIPSCSATSC